MTSPVTEPMRHEHALLLDHVEHIRLAAREVPELSEEERGAVVARVLEFLQHTLIPHAEVEERVLYEAVGELIGGEAATAPMVADHQAIHVFVGRLAEADLAKTALLQELLYGLHALITTHFRKEEELYFPVLERGAA